MTDMSRPFETIALELINAKNPGLNLQASDFTLGPPTAATGLTDGRNTIIEVRSTPTSRYQGNAPVNYRRVDLDTIAATDDDLIITTELTTIDLLPAINERYELNLTAADIVDAPLPDTQSDPGTAVIVTITALSGSYYVIGSGELSIVSLKSNLDDAITDPDLDGLDYTPPA